MAAETSTYGLAFELPSGWVDWTAYKFRASVGPLKEVSVVREALPAEKARPWLEASRRRVASLDGAHVGPVEAYPHPRLVPQGFDASFGDDASTAARFGMVLLPEGAECIVLRFKGAAGSEPLVRQIVASLGEPATPGGAGHVYAACGLTLTSPVPLETPSQFRYASSDDIDALIITYSSAPPELVEPEWPTRFSYPPDAPLVVQQSATFFTSGRATLTNPPPRFEILQSLATVTIPKASMELTYCAATAPAGGRFVELQFTSSRGFARAVPVFTAVVESLRSES